MSEINEVGSDSDVFSSLVLVRMDHLPIVKLSFALRYLPSFLFGMGRVDISEGIESWAPRSLSRASYPSVIFSALPPEYSAAVSMMSQEASKVCFWLSTL